MVCTILIAILVLAASLVGLFTEIPYALETQNWRLQAQGQDIGNLISIVVLLISATFAKEGSTRAYSNWLVAFLLVTRVHHTRYSNAP